MIDLWGGCAYEELGHTAEIGMRVRATSPAGLFSCAARAMFALVGAKASDDGEFKTESVIIHAVDMESLMVEWLNQLVYFHETTGVVFDHFDHIVIHDWSPTHLTATIGGRRTHETPHTQIKAVTYHDLVVKAEGDGWTAQIYFDI